MSKTWSLQQENIFEFVANGTGNGVVIARAGTGKTTTIIEAINRIKDGLKVICCAFNRSIAIELKSRMNNENASASTLHSIGFQCVIRFWEGIDVKPGFGRQDSLTEKVCGSRVPDAIKRLITKAHTKAREMKPHATRVGEITDILYQFELEPDEYWENAGYDLRFIESKALEAMELAASVKPVETGIDYADMIFLPVRNGWLVPMYDFVIVDEAQDMTEAQLEIAVGICKKNGRILLVGDNKQAIYGFRGADSHSLSRLKAELNAQEFSLNITYRCGRSIVELAQRLVPDFTAAPTAHDGTVTDITEARIMDMVKGGDFILSRTNAPLVRMALSLLKNQQRARIAGKKEFGDEFKKLVKTLARGRGVNSIPEFLKKLELWRAKQVKRLAAAKKDAMIDTVNDKAEVLIAIAEVAKSISDIETRLDVLFTDDGLGQVNVITCSSIHRSKGLEADRVFLLVNTLYPRGRNEEEENIEYVAITRAKRELYRAA